MQYNKIDGTQTTNRDEYLESWITLITKIETAFDVMCIGFDPGILLRGKYVYAESIRLPIWFAEQLVKKLDECSCGGMAYTADLKSAPGAG